MLWDRDYKSNTVTVCIRICRCSVIYWTFFTVCIALYYYYKNHRRMYVPKTSDTRRPCELGERVCNIFPQPPPTYSFWGLRKIVAYSHSYLAVLGTVSSLRPSSTCSLRCKKVPVVFTTRKGTSLKQYCILNANSVIISKVGET